MKQNMFSVAENFGAPFASRLLELYRARVYFARTTIAIAKIRDYSQSTNHTKSI